MKELSFSRFQIFRDRLNLLFSRGQVRADLPSILLELRAQSPLRDRIETFERLMSWLRLPVSDGMSGNSSRGVRFRFLLQLLDRNPEWKVSFVEVIRSLMMEASAVRLLCQTGLNQESGFFSEASDRFTRRWLPHPAGETDLAALFSHIFDSEEDAEWIESSPDAVVIPILNLLNSVPLKASAIPKFQKAVLDALVVLGANIAATGVSEDIRSRLKSSEISDSPFIALNRLVSNTEIFEHDFFDFSEVSTQIAQCRSALDIIFRHIEQTGVSVALVYKLERLGASLNRIELLIRLQRAKQTNELASILPGFLGSLIRDEIINEHVSSLIRGNLHLLARKIVERTSHHGEHYIARTRSELLHALVSAAGGGFLTIFTALFKLWIGKAKFALFFEGFFSWINYASSFLSMQFLGLTLATKQPSMTASSLSGTLEQYERTGDVEVVTEEIAVITRSQVAAAVGNLGAVIPGAILLNLFWKWIYGHSVMDTTYAHYFIASLNPFTSLTIPFAALTGVLLWASSVAAGWSENWVVYRRLPQALSESQKLNHIFGHARMEKWVQKFSTTISGVVGNTTLGFFLAFIPVFGRFFGLAIDVRHVTLSAGAATLAVCSLGFQSMHWTDLAMLVFGILVIGILNFGVSFMLALEVAARSREINKRFRLAKILRLVGRRFLSSPLKFLLGSARPAEQ